MVNQTAGEQDAPCTILSVIHLMGKRWTIPIIEALFYAKGEVSFNMLQATLPHVTPKNLSDSLRELVDFDLVKKGEETENGVKHTSYVLTRNGFAFQDMIFEAKRIGGKMYNRKGCEMKQCAACPLFK